MPPRHNAVADELVAAGTRDVFSLVGDDTIRLLTDLVDRCGVEHFPARHESTAVAMAAGYAWKSGRLGVALLTRGPGFSNAVNAAATAVRARRAVLVIIGAPPTNAGPWQDPKASYEFSIAAAIGMEFVHPIESGEVQRATRHAIALARGGRPTILAIPTNLLHEDVDDDTDVAGAGGFKDEAELVVDRFSKATAAEIEGVVDLLSAASRPVIVAGRGAQAAETKMRLERLAERTGALLGTTYEAKDLFRGNAFDLGIVGGFSSEEARLRLEEADCGVVFGASLNSFTTMHNRLFRGAPVIQIDRDPERIGAYYPVEHGIVGDAGAVAQQILDALPEREGVASFHDPEVLARLARGYDGTDESSDDELDPRTLTAALNGILPADTTMVLDAGAMFGWPAMHLRVSGPDHVLSTHHYGSIGMGFGHALGACVANREGTTVLLAGDGGFMMAVGDLDTLRHYNLPLAVVIYNDAAFGAERHLMDLANLRHEQSLLAPVDFVALARGFGIEGATVRSLNDLDAVAAKLSEGIPFVVDCKIRGDIRPRWLEEIAAAWEEADAAAGATSAG